MNPGKSILFVVTNCDRIDSDHPTGLWLEEFAVPFEAFREAGFDVEVASPGGGSAPIDPRSTPPEEQKEQWAAARKALEKTRPLNRVDSAPFEALFLPGGHGTMFDLPECKALQRLLETFEGQEKVIAAVCHGPAGLVGALGKDGRPLVAGRTLTAFTDAEEKTVELDGLMPFLLESRLRELGAKFVTGSNWQDHVERDGNLITGQNPQSSASTARAVLELLNRGD
ncbi:MAG: glutamine amidotransferase [Desulfuromonas sp.]|uniref:type 1 glutamine amidotransferase domain-containing protein n=1 Tax=Desulfuromonas sp. TaxID=892 RepID=UPI000CB118A7|nr:type 1 glutamine amidotransferase domain-containing protein [Desulfuromonas sp.]PLX84733.1 MAG: glutamine amidotransferase [Desulfuromonas sp.]